MTSMAGNSASSIIRAVVSRPMPRAMRSTRNAERATTSSSLPSSDGWRLKNGSGIQRLEPRVARGRARSTSRIATIMSP